MVRFSPVRFDSGGLLVAAQTALAVLGMGWIMAAPQAGEPAALYPVTAPAKAALGAVLSHPDARLLGPGPIAGSYAVIPASADPVTMLIHHGVLMLATNPAGCGPVADPGA